MGLPWDCIYIGVVVCGVNVGIESINIECMGKKQGLLEVEKVVFVGNCNLSFLFEHKPGL